MSMGKRKRDRQPTMWVPTTELPIAASHPFYRRLNQLLREHDFDDFVEAQCVGFYAKTMGRPSLPPGIYFRLLLIGYFEGIDSERGIVWRVADSRQVGPTKKVSPGFCSKASRLAPDFRRRAAAYRP